MKIAAGIIGLIIGLLVLLQSCAVATTASLAEIEIGKQEGSVGVFVAFAMFVGGAFAFGLPGVASAIFFVAGGLALLASTTFADLAIWGGVAWVLAAMTGWASYSARRARKANKPPVAG